MKPPILTFALFDVNLLDLMGLLEVEDRQVYKIKQKA